MNVSINKDAVAWGTAGAVMERCEEEALKTGPVIFFKELMHRNPGKSHLDKIVMLVISNQTLLTLCHRILSEITSIKIEKDMNVSESFVDTVNQLIQNMTTLLRRIGMTPINDPNFVANTKSACRYTRDHITNRLYTIGTIVRANDALLEKVPSIEFLDVQLAAFHKACKDIGLS